MHAWLRISLPLSRPMESKPALLPILYQVARAGSDRETVVGSDVDSAPDDAVGGKNKLALLSEIISELMISAFQRWTRRPTPTCYGEAIAQERHGQMLTGFTCASDECLQPIASAWYRCATCPTSPDLCEACFKRGSTKHDINHIVRLRFSLRYQPS